MYNARGFAPTAAVGLADSTNGSDGDPNQQTRRTYYMLTASKLEKIIELEDSLRSQYQAQLDAKSAEIDLGIKKQQEQQKHTKKQNTAKAHRNKAAKTTDAYHRDCLLQTVIAVV